MVAQRSVRVDELQGSFMLSHGPCMYTYVILAVVAAISMHDWDAQRSIHKEELQSQDSSQAALHDMLLRCCTCP